MGNIGIHRPLLDYFMIPELFYQNEDDFADNLFLIPASALADVYQQYNMDSNPGRKEYRPFDFAVSTRQYSGDRELVYISLLGQDPLQEVPGAVLRELLDTMSSCASPPLTDDLEDRARWLMSRVEYFRENGVPEEALYLLEMRIPQYMPDFTARNFPEFFRFLHQDLTAIYFAMEYFVSQGNFEAAKKISDPLVQYLEANREALTKGRACYQNPFEMALALLEKPDGRDFEKIKHTKDNYTAFLVTYARILQGLAGEKDKKLRMEQSRQYLFWAREMSPVNASVWLYLGVSFMDDAVRAPAFFQQALHYCFLKNGDYGLTAIYKSMALYYCKEGRYELANALCQLVRELGEDMPEPALPPLPSARPCREILTENGIQVGFSRFVKEAAQYIAEMGIPEDHPEVRETIQEIQSVP